MNSHPMAEPRSQGRVFGADWSIANVAALLRSKAARGVWRPGSTAGGGYAAKINQQYIQAVSAQHLPTNVSLIFMQLDDCWCASLCFCAAGELLPWQENLAEQWLWALFGQDRPRVRPSDEGHGPCNLSVRNFTLSPE
jgi:hypothetical protein